MTAHSFASQVLAHITAAGDDGVTIRELATAIYGDGRTTARIWDALSSLQGGRHIVCIGKRKPDSGGRPINIWAASVADAAVHAASVKPKTPLCEKRYAVLGEAETNPELAAHADALRRRFAPVAPLRGGRWLVCGYELEAGDMVALARGEVRLRELVE